MFFQKIDETISSWMLEIHGSSFFNYLMKIFSILGEGGLIWILFLLAILIFVVVNLFDLLIHFVVEYTD